MEKKLPNDDLEQFIKSSFEKYEENPSNGVWDNIEQTLNKKPISGFRIKPLLPWALAATVIGLIFLYQFKTNQSLKNQIKELANKQINQNSIYSKNNDIKIKSPHDTLTTYIPNNTQNVMSQNNLEEDKLFNGKELAAIDKAIPIHSPNANSNLPIDKNNSEINLKTKLSHSAVKNINSSKNSKNENNKIVESNKQISPLKSKQLNQKSKISTENIENRNKLGNQISNASNIIKNKQSITNDKSSPINSANKVSELESTVFTGNESILQATENRRLIITRLERKSIMTLNPVNAIPSSFNLSKVTESMPILLHSSAIKSGLNLALHGGTLYEQGTIQLPKQRDPSPHPGQAVTNFSSNGSFLVNAEISKSISNHWLVGSGLAYKHFDLNSKSKVETNFGGRQAPPPGRQPHQHDFKYKIHSAAGTGELEVRSEQADTRATIADNEKIDIEINSETQLNYLSIPLFIRYKTLASKWSLELSAGLQADIFVNEKVESPVVKIISDKLLLRKDLRPVFKINKPNLFVLNGSLAPSIRYQANPSWSVALRPDIYLPLTNRQSTDNFQINSRNFAFTFGLQYAL